jgi:hypothetical protein
VQFERLAGGTFRFALVQYVAMRTRAARSLTASRTASSDSNDGSLTMSNPASRVASSGRSSGS